MSRFIQSSSENKTPKGKKEAAPKPLPKTGTYSAENLMNTKRIISSNGGTY